MEDQPFCSSRRLQNIPPSVTVEPPPPPQRKILDTNGSFEPVGVSEILGEPKLRINQEKAFAVEIEDLQDDEFPRNFNPLLTDLKDHVVIEVLPFSSPVIGVPLSKDMSSASEGIYTPTSSILAGGVQPPLVGTPRVSAYDAPISLSSRVVQNLAPYNVVDPSREVVN